MSTAPHTEADLWPNRNRESVDAWESSRRLKRNAHKVAFENTVRTAVTIAMALVIAAFLTGYDRLTHVLLEAKAQTVRELHRTHGLGVAIVVQVLIALVCTGSAAFLVVQHAPAASGGGLVAVQTFLNGSEYRGFFGARTFVARAVGLILAAMGSMFVGLEAPMVHLGAIAAFQFAKLPSKTSAFPLKVPTFDTPQERQDFVAMGAVLGLSIAYQAPFGALLYVLESEENFWHDRITWRTLLGCIVSLLVVRLTNGGLSSMNFHVPLFGTLSLYGDRSGASFFVDGADLGRYFVLALLCGLCGGLFNRGVAWLTELRKRFVASPRRRVLEVLAVATLSVVLRAVLPLAVGCAPQGEPTAIIPGAAVEHARNSTTVALGSSSAIVTIHAAGFDVPLVEECKHHLARPCGVSEMRGLSLTCGASGTGSYCRDEGSATEHCVCDVGYCAVRGECVSQYGDKLEQDSYCSGATVDELAVLFAEPNDAVVRHLFSEYRVVSLRAESLAVFFVAWLLMLLVTQGTAVPHGLLTPMIIVGASLGRLLGELWDGDSTPVHVYAVLGASGMLASYSFLSACLAVILLETTGNLQYMVPVMLTVVISRVVSAAVYEKSYYATTVTARAWLVMPPQSVEVPHARVSEAIAGPPTWLPPKEHLGRILLLLLSTGHHAFPVCALHTAKSVVPRIHGLCTREGLINALRSHLRKARQAKKKRNTRVSGDLARQGSNLSQLARLTKGDAQLPGEPMRGNSKDSHRGRDSQDMSSKTPSLTPLASPEAPLPTMRKNKENKEGRSARWQKKKNAWREAMAPFSPTLTAPNKNAELANEFKDGTWVDLLADESLWDEVVDLRPFTELSPLRVAETESAALAWSIFRSLGLRHLVVVDDGMQCTGVLTRIDFVRLERAAQGLATPEDEDLPREDAAARVRNALLADALELWYDRYFGISEGKQDAVYGFNTPSERTVTATGPSPSREILTEFPQSEAQFVDESDEDTDEDGGLEAFDELEEEAWNEENEPEAM